MGDEGSWPPPEIERTGLRPKELCDLFGLNYKAEALNAKLLGLSTHDYLQQLTGWQLRYERYYPPQRNSQTISDFDAPIL
ncbi:MAG: hypothetical protein AAFY17_14730 [Cyanobacteria bacterium J06642_11]